MANIERTVDIIFGGKNELDKTIKDVGKGLDSLDRTVHGITGPLADIGNKILKLDAALATLAAGGLALATKTAGEFRDQVNEVATLTDLSGKEVGDFRKSILDYARDSSSSIDDINSALYQAISLGTDYADSLSVLSQAEQLAIAGKADLTGTIELLISTLNAYGGSIDDASRYSDVFFQTVKLGKTTIPELAGNLSNVIGIASSAGVPIETLSAAMAALTASGVPTAEAVTGIKSAINNIITPTAKASKLADDLGISFGASALKSKGFDGVLRDIYNATGGNVEQIGGLIGNVRGLNAALILGADKSGRFAEALESMQNAAGVTQAAYEKMSDNFGLINQNLANNIRATFIQIGDPILESYGNIADGVTNILKGIGISIDVGSFDPIFDAIKDFGQGLTNLLNGIAEALPEALEGIDYSKLIDSFGDLGKIIGGFFGDLDLSKPEDLRKVIQEVVNTGESLVRVSGGMIKVFKEIWEQIKEGIKSFNEMDDSSKESSGAVLGAAVVIAEAGVKISLALLAIKASGADIENVFNVVAGSIKFMWNSLQVTFDLIVSSILGSINHILKIADTLTFGTSDTVKNGMREIELIQKAVQKSMLQNSMDIRDSWKIMTKGFDDAGESVKDVGEKADKAADKAKGLPNAMTEAEAKAYLYNLQLQEIGQKIVDDSQAASKFHEVMGDDKSKQAMQELDKAVFNTGKSLDDAGKSADVLKTELETAADVAIAKFQEVADITKTGIEWKAKIDIAELETEAQRIVSAFDSLQGSTSSSADAVSSMFGDLVNFMDTANKPSNLGDNIEKDAEQAERAMDELESRMDEIAEFEEKIFGKRKKIGEKETELTATWSNLEDVKKDLADVLSGKITEIDVQLAVEKAEEKQDELNERIKSGKLHANKLNKEYSELQKLQDRAAFLQEAINDPLSLAVSLEGEANKLREKSENIQKDIGGLEGDILGIEQERAEKIKDMNDFLDDQSGILDKVKDKTSQAFMPDVDEINRKLDQIVFPQSGIGSSEAYAGLRLENLVKEELSIQEKLADAQVELTNAQIKALEQRTRAMSSGNALVTVDGSGLQPHLEAFMWEILSAIQVRVNEEYGEFLLGI